tara:strand:- start:820 stop:1791 length:972 start_codon:yes stop_codon:yes gene_type:complete
MKKLLRRFMTTLMLALYNTEKSSLAQNNTAMGADVGHEQSVNQGTMLDDLMHGRVTVEVMNLRWRIYKVLEAASNIRINHTMDADGNVTYKSQTYDRSKELKKIKVDDFDSYPLEMVIDNTPKPKESHESFNGDKVLETDKRTNEIEGGDATRVLGEVSSDEYFTMVQSEIKVKIGRTHPPKFNLEKYTRKLNVRGIDADTKLLEFYVSKYPNEYDRRSDVFIKNVLKIDENPRISSIIDFDTVSFITYNDSGVGNNRLYEYDNLVYDKTVEFDGSYIVKMKAKVVTDGESQVEQYRMTELDEKYENNERRNEDSNSTYTLQF